MYIPKIVKLENNLTVVLDYLSHVETVSLGLFMGIGSRIENKSNNGICHFLEHMFFKGTKNRDMYQISEGIESKGGFINAWTSKDKTALYAKVIKKEAMLATDIIFDIAHNSIFPKDELEKEKKVVIEEIKQSKDDPYDLIYNYFQTLCYGNNSLAMPILGTEDTVSSFSDVDLNNHLSNYYSNNNMVFVISGNFDENNILEKINNVSSKSKNSQVVTFNKANNVSSKGVLLKEDLSQAHIIISYPSYGYLGSEGYYVYLIISAILGRGMSSRLFKEIREKRGLAYSIYSFYNAYKDVASLCVQAACSYENTNQVIDVTNQEISNLARNEVSDEELLKAKNQIISSLYMSLESSYNRAEKWANNILTFNKIINPEEITNKINSVTKESILETGKKLLLEEPTIAVLSNKSVIF